MNDVTVLIGGIIPEADIPGSKKAGIAEIFLPGTSTQAIVDFIRSRMRAPRRTEPWPRSLTLRLHLRTCMTTVRADESTSAAIRPPSEKQPRNGGPA